LYISEKIHKEMEIVVVEPNINTHNTLKLVDLNIGLSADICVYLVDHREFLQEKIKKNDIVFY